MDTLLLLLYNIVKSSTVNFLQSLVLWSSSDSTIRECHGWSLWEGRWCSTQRWRRIQSNSLKTWGPALRHTIKEISGTAACCSHWLWIRRKDPSLALRSRAQLLRSGQPALGLPARRGCIVSKKLKNLMMLRYTTKDLSVPSTGWGPLGIILSREPSKGKQGNYQHTCCENFSNCQTDLWSFKFFFFFNTNFPSCRNTSLSSFSCLSTFLICFISLIQTNNLTPLSNNLSTTVRFPDNIFMCIQL